MELKVVTQQETLQGELIALRLVTLEDCTDTYRAWLADPEVNRYLETRWHEQTLERIREFVSAMLVSPDNYLFAITQLTSGKHIGNIKLGPVNWYHRCADVSYFVGDRTAWGQGMATDAIRVVTRMGFSKLGLHRLQAGLYSGNVASARALEKAGYIREGSMRSQLQGPAGWEDHVWYGILAHEFSAKTGKQ